jgi:hypothetical protein
MIRRGVGALLVLSLMLTCAPPAQAQPAPAPPAPRRSEPTLLWAILGAAAGAALGSLGAGFNERFRPGSFPDTWSSQRKILTGTATGAAIGAGVGFVIGRLRAREAVDLYFVTIAEGLTSATLTEGIRVAPRGFTASQLVEACKDPRVVDRLEVAPNPLEMREDGRYALNSLSVVAVNAADLAMAGVPIVLEAEEVSPPVVQLRSDDADVMAGRLHAVGIGSFQMRVRTMCGTPHAEKIIQGRVSR